MLHRQGVLPRLLRIVRAGATRPVSIGAAQAFASGGALDLPGAPIPVATHGHTAYHVPQHGVIITGDALVTAHPLSKLRGPQLLPPVFDHGPADTRAALDHLAALDAQTVVPGHDPGLHADCGGGRAGWGPTSVVLGNGVYCCAVGVLVTGVASGLRRRGRRSSPCWVASGPMSQRATSPISAGWVTAPAHRAGDLDCQTRPRVERRGGPAGSVPTGGHAPAMTESITDQVATRLCGTGVPRVPSMDGVTRCRTRSDMARDGQASVAQIDVVDAKLADALRPRGVHRVQRHGRRAAGVAAAVRESRISAGCSGCTMR